MRRRAGALLLPAEAAGDQGLDAAAGQRLDDPPAGRAEFDGEDQELEERGSRVLGGSSDRR
jgi:hypothetical protein